MNRGNRREDIFFDTRDREKFYEILTLGMDCIKIWQEKIYCHRGVFRICSGRDKRRKQPRIESNGPKVWSAELFFCE